MPARILTILLGLTLVLALACGTDATATPAATSAPQPTSVQPAAPAAVATATPAPTVNPAVVVNPGKLTVMVGDFGNERFDRLFGQGPGVNYARIVGGYLISNNERKEMLPGIASQWGLSTDGLTWNFTIRKGVRFHDGSEITPQDVLWTLQHSFAPQALEYAMHTDAIGISRRMDRIELTGPDKVSVTTKQPVIQLADLVSESGIFWYHVIPKRAKLHDLSEEEAYDKNPIGAGPMRLVNHVPASVMKFERFDDFYYQPKNGFPEDKRVRFQSLDMYLAPEVATRVAAMRAGEVDLIPASIATKRQIEAGGGRLVFGPEGAHVSVKLVGCWKTEFPCHDKRVRQALDYAIDKNLLRDRLFGGPDVFVVKGWHFVTPSTIGYTPELDPWPQDVAKARQLLADAGYPGGKGFGKLIVNTYPSTSMPLLPESAQLAAEFWKRELGLDVEVNVSDSTGTSKRDGAGELFGQVIWGQNETRRDATGITTDLYGNPQRTSRAHDDPELFRLVEKTFAILEADKRAEASKTLYLRLRDESDNLGIGYLNIPWGVGPRVLTWKPYPLELWPSALHSITLK